jgi:integrase
MSDQERRPKSKRSYGDGGIDWRSENVYRLRYRIGEKQERKQYSKTFHGTLDEARKELRRLLRTGDTGEHVAPDKATVSEFVKARIDQWESAGTITARTADRYRQLLTNQITPHLGSKLLQKLRPLDIEEWHTALRKGGLAPRTIGHAHRVLSSALSDAAKNELITKNVAKTHSAPKVADDEDMVIVQDVPALTEKLKGGSRIQLLAMVALFTGMRLGEVLALRWARVDLEKNVIQVREALEETRRHGIRFKTPKSKAGRRDITLPDILVNPLRENRKAQLELRMKLGAGKLSNDALLFADIDGAPLSSIACSKAWGKFADRIGMPEVTYHALRHTHASQLIDAGVDIVTISKRLGHAKPDITLRIYAHLFRKDDGKAAAAINAILGN